MDLDISLFILLKCRLLLGGLLFVFVSFLLTRIRDFIGWSVGLHLVNISGPSGGSLRLLVHFLRVALRSLSIIIDWAEVISRMTRRRSLRLRCFRFIVVLELHVVLVDPLVSRSAI